MSAEQRLDEIQARAEKATDGPWEADHSEEDNSAVKPVGADWIDGLAFAGLEADAEFIAHARQDVPRLVATLRAVLDLHVGVVDCCDECSPMKCAVCEAWEWPCDTVCAVEAALGEVAQ